MNRNVLFLSSALLLAVTACSREKAAEPAAPASAETAAAETPAQDPAEPAPEEAAPADIPDTEIFLASLSFANGAPAVGELKNATNEAGYDNQPSFLPGEAAFYFVSEGDSGKTDIFLYDIARGARQQLFSSPTVSEYSPKRAPDGINISYIQEDESGEMTRVHQRLIDASDEGAPVADFAPLGYYAWLDGGKQLGVYYRSEPGSLHIIDVGSGEALEVHQNIGRVMVADKAGANLWFTEAPPFDPAAAPDAPPAGPFKVMRYEVAGEAVSPVFDLPANAQDLCVVFDASGAPSGYFTADAATLYYRSAAADAAWAPAADLAAAGMKAATRVAVSDDGKWIAVVGEKAE